MVKVTNKNIKKYNKSKEDEIEYVKKYGKSAIGKSDYIDYLSGKYLAGKRRIFAMCYWCMGYYTDGKIDCNCPLCPNYTYMPYLNIKKDTSDDENDL